MSRNNGIFKFIIFISCLSIIAFSFSALNKEKAYKAYLSEQKKFIQKKQPSKMQEELVCSVESPDVYEGKNIVERFAEPFGYSRVPYENDSFGEYVRSYPIYSYGSKVLMYDGSQSDRQWMAAAVFQLPLENYDLQQCADSVMRWYAEYYFAIQKHECIRFHFIDGSLHSWVESEGYDGTYENLLDFLKVVFNHANTVSLEGESELVSFNDLQIGDILVRGGYPGHALMVVDVAENEKGNRAILLGQGLMPAQQFHVVINPGHINDPWYYYTELSDTITTPGYTFLVTDFKRPIFGTE